MAEHAVRGESQGDEREQREEVRTRRGERGEPSRRPPPVATVRFVVRRRVRAVGDTSRLRSSRDVNPSLPL